MMVLHRAAAALCLAAAGPARNVRRNAWPLNLGVSHTAIDRSAYSKRPWRSVGMPSNKLAVHSDPDILGGKPVFVGTRVPF